MQQTQQISSLDQLLDYAVLVAQGEATWENAELLPGCATISLRVCGAGWDSKIDARGARLIISLQKNIDTIFTYYQNQLPAKAPLIKVESRKGSNDLWALFEPCIREVILKLSPEQVVDIIKYGLLCGTGLWAYLKTMSTIRQDREHARETAAEITSSEQTKQQQLRTLEVLEKAVDKIGSVIPQDEAAEAHYSQPIRDYTRSLSPEDSVSFAQTPPIKVYDVRPLFKAKRRPRSRTRWVACDNAFICSGINLEQPQPRLEIEQDNIKLTALIERLSHEERSSLMEKIDKRIEKRQMPFRINLRMNVYFTDTGIKHASVIGIGSQRQKIHIHRLGDIPGNIKNAFDEFSSPPEE